GGGQGPFVFVGRVCLFPARAEHWDQGGVGPRGRAPRDGDPPAVDENLTRRVAAHHDGVIEAVAEHRQQAGGREKAGLNSHGRSPFEDLASAQMRVSCESVWFNGCRRHGGVLRCGRDDRLEAELAPVLNLCGDSLKIFCIWYSATAAVAADDYLTSHRLAATRSRLSNGGCFALPLRRFRD